MADFEMNFDEKLRRSRDRINVESSENWYGITENIPALKFPPGWEVKIMPPFGGAMARFCAMKDGASVSVYADYYDRLGHFGEPHWEIYPGPDGSNERYAIQDTETVIAKIEKSLSRQIAGTLPPE